MDLITVFQLAMADWWANIAIALGINGAVIAIGWMVADAIQKADVKSWARKEFGEFILSCVIVGVVATVLMILSAVTIALLPKDVSPALGLPHFEAAKGFFDAPGVGLYFQTMEISQSLTVKTLWYEIIGDIWFDYLGIITLKPITQFLPVVGPFIAALPKVIGRPFGSVDDISTSIDSYVGFSFLSSLLALAQLKVLEFFETVSLPFIFSLGIVMRAFPLTRKVGSTLVAIGIIGAFVYPLSIVLSKEIYNRAAPYIGAPQFFTTNFPPGSGVGVISPAEGSNVSFDSTITWAIGAENGTYRVWKSMAAYFGLYAPLQVCNFCSSFSRDTNKCSNSSQPELDETIVQWAPPADEGTQFRCFLLSNKSRKFEGGRVVEKVGDLVTKGENNDLASFVLDAYDNSTPPKAVGWAEIRLVVGDPCKKYIWRRARCWMGIRYSIERGATIAGSGKAMAEGYATGFWRVITDEIGGVFKGYGLFSLATPVLAGRWYLLMSEKLPTLLFPPFMVILTLAISGFISLSTFRSISGAIGGETELPGLAKVI